MAPSSCATKSRGLWVGHAKNSTVYPNPTHKPRDFVTQLEGATRKEATRLGTTDKVVMQFSIECVEPRRHVSRNIKIPHTPNQPSPLRRQSPGPYRRHTLDPKDRAPKLLRRITPLGRKVMNRNPRRLKDLVHNLIPLPTPGLLVALVIQLHHAPKRNITLDLNLLVIGAQSSPCWAFSAYGRKVETAIKYHRQGAPITIIGEDCFLGALSDR